jgi:hypothetical protein
MSRSLRAIGEFPQPGDRLAVWDRLGYQQIAVAEVRHAGPTHITVRSRLTTVPGDQPVEYAIERRLWEQKCQPPSRPPATEES